MKDLINKIAQFFGEDFAEHGDDARLELTPAELRQICNLISKYARLKTKLKFIEKEAHTADVVEQKANNFDIHNVKYSDNDYPISMLLVDGKENYSLISMDGVILVPLYQVIDKLMCVKPDEILRNGKRICPNCGADMGGKERR